MKKIDKTTAWILFLLTGWSYGQFNQYGLQAFYYATVIVFLAFATAITTFAIFVPVIWNIAIIAKFNESIDNHNTEE